MKYIVNAVPTTPSMIIRSRKIPQYLASAAATIGGFGMGTALAWSSPGIPNLQKSGDMGTISDAHKAWIGSLVTVGALVGAPTAGWCIEKFGRKMSMLALALPFIIGWFSIALAQNVLFLCAGRFLTGFGVGALSLAAPVYICEISDDRIRGTLGAAFQLMVSLGILFTFVIGSCVTWSNLAIICSIVPMLFFTAMIFMPESPRYYLSKGKFPEANKALSWLRASDYLDPTKEILQELENIQNNIEQANEEAATFRDFFKISIMKPVLVIMTLMFCNQFCGVNAVGFYTTEIFEISESGIDSNLSTIIVGIVQVIATLVASVLVDRKGRRILLLLSFLTMSISLVFLGAFFLLKKDESFNNDFISWLPLTSLVSFNVGYFIGLGSLVWTVMSELLPSNIIGLTSAIATTFNWSLAFIVTRFFHDMKTILGIEWCFWLFAITCALGAVFVYVWVPETKGKSLEQIQTNFKFKKPKTSESKVELVEV